MAELTTMTNQHPDFYRVLGPFLARREVHKAVGAPVYDDDGKVWIIAMDGHEVAGFLGLENRKGAIAIRSCYLVPGYEALRADLVQAAIDHTAPSPLVATVHADHAALYTDKFGFEVVRSKGRWVSLARAAGEPK